jgi:hypothetical protein
MSRLIQMGDQPHPNQPKGIPTTCAGRAWRKEEVLIPNAFTSIRLAIGASP